MVGLFPLRLPAFLVGLACLATGTGCVFSSRWAMDDPDYAAKYGGPYAERGFKKHRRMAKQLVDARFLKEKDGGYVEFLGQVDPDRGGLTVGITNQVQPWFAPRAGLTGLLSEGHGFLVGGDVGFRAMVPSRLAPFVGLGGFAGYEVREIVVEQDSVSLNPVVTDPPWTASPSTQKDAGGLAAIYPEAGATFWMNGHSSVTAFGRYFISSDGRDADSWMIGVGFTLLTGPRTGDKSVDLPRQLPTIPDPEPAAGAITPENLSQHLDLPAPAPELTPESVDQNTGNDDSPAEH